jgi:DNA mismatch endonuclease (patch repair protein)
LMPVQDYPYPKSSAVTASMKGNRRTDTSPELLLRSALHRRGYRFRKDYSIPIGDRKRARPDIVFTRRKVAVFVDGCFWHSCPEHGNQPKHNTTYWKAKLARNHERDEQQTRALEGLGWDVLRVWEHSDVGSAADQVAALVDS